jgi:hypothetical protein
LPEKLFAQANEDSAASRSWARRLIAAGVRAHVDCRLDRGDCACGVVIHDVLSVGRPGSKVWAVSRVESYIVTLN